MRSRVTARERSRATRTRPLARCAGRHPRLSAGQRGEHRERALTLLARCRDVGAHPQVARRALLGAPGSRDLLLQLDHADVLLGEIVGERDTEVISESERLGLLAVQAQQQVLGLAALHASGLLSRPGRGAAHSPRR